MRLPDEDGIRQLYTLVEAALARVSVLERRRDIHYRNAFKAAGEQGCIVRECGAKSSSSKNDARHLKNTRTPEHEIAAILLQQKECLQCGREWKTSAGLDYHEQTDHGETRSSRMETFRTYLEQPLSAYIPGRHSTQPPPPGQDSLQRSVSEVISEANLSSWSSSNDLRPLADSTPADSLQHPQQSGTESLSLHECDLLQPNWSSSNDFQPWENGESTYSSMQPLQQGLNGLFPTTSAPIYPDWSLSEHSQRSTAAAITNHSTQSPPSEYVLPQPSWSGSNDLYHPGHY